MCGIFGLVFHNPKNFHVKSKKLINSLFIESESRGKEASGFCFINETNIFIGKTSNPSNILIKNQDYKDCFNNFIKTNSSFYTCFGHARLVTHGYEHFYENNQPVIFKNYILVHNGIVVNYNELWKKYFPDLIPKTNLDTEIIPALYDYFLSKSNDYRKAISEVFSITEGVINITLFNTKEQSIILTTNNGSLYYFTNSEYFIWASEYSIIKNSLSKNKIPFKNNEIIKIQNSEIIKKNIESNINFCSQEIIQIDFDEKLKLKYINTSLEYNQRNSVPIAFINYSKLVETEISKLKRCTKCLLPESFPYIYFNEKGICNYCSSHQSIILLGVDKLKELINKTKSKKCLVAFSGGRDSSFCLHYIKKVLNLEPIAYSYDWGMLTDLGRRNQSRMCAKLGVEHILVSADIRKKRKNIQLNVNAWLKKPDLGTIPLFMAGDKQYFYHAYRIMKEYNLPTLIMGENFLEKTGFKTAFSGAKQTNSGYMAYHISIANKIRMANYYLMQFLSNPKYINSSLIDTIGAIISYYGLKHNYINLFNYIPWSESEVNNILINEYNWETDPDIESTWRIGDGTAAFYNYIYHTVSGFTEADTFRSNQIREGLISREGAFIKLQNENKPRWNSIKWYCDTIGIDFEKTIQIINNIKKRY
ncbi:MAG: hypothetical protein A2046_14175 [Bacteroidetes bacterium GWA2_30_7]|nr:MAG: hypothetical protein A2046_14175 [Bacteroidetes bacterium GWA2_30_7]